MARPVEINKGGSRLIVWASVCVVIASLYFGREIFIPLSLAILLSFLLSPPIRWLERLKLSRVAATLIVVLLGMAFVGSIGYMVGSQVKSVAEQWPSYRGEFVKKIAGMKSHFGFFHKAEQELQGLSAAATTIPTQPVSATDHSIPPPQRLSHDLPVGGAAVETPVPVRVVTPEQSILQIIAQYADTVLSPLATAALVFILLIFMLLTREDLRDRMIRLIGHGRLNLTTQALDEAGTRISRYLGALAIVNTGYGLCVVIGLYLSAKLFGHDVAFPNVLVWGLLVGLFRFVPYLGIFIGAALPILLSFALFQGSGVFISVVALFVALEIVVSQFIEPYWYGSSTGMSALAVLVAAMFWTWLWGPIGLLLSTPLTVCLVVMGKYVPQLQFLDIILGDEPVLPPHMKIYQRLIASDEEEAADFARELLEDKPLEELYDQVLIPALAMAEQDHHRGNLDDEKLAFVRQSLRDLLDELVEEARTRRSTIQAADAAATEPKVASPIVLRPSLAKDCSINVLCVPARSESDEIVAIMLAQLLELRDYTATAASPDLLASEMVELIDKQRIQIVCVSAMPPAAVAHSRYLCKRIHARFPNISLLVGVWLSKADVAKTKRRIACAENVNTVTTLVQAQEHIDQMVHGILARDSKDPEPATVP